jgi:hypothetical protein
MAPLLPCDPERFVDLVCDYASSIWVGAMNYPEINNRPYLLEKYRDFFEARAYSNTIHTITSLFKNSRMGRSIRVRDTSMSRKSLLSTAQQTVRAKSHPRQIDMQLKLL